MFAKKALAVAGLALVTATISLAAERVALVEDGRPRGHRTRRKALMRPNGLGHRLSGRAARPLAVWSYRRGAVGRHPASRNQYPASSPASPPATQARVRKTKPLSSAMC